MTKSSPTTIIPTELAAVRAKLLNGLVPRTVGSADGVEGRPKPTESGLSAFEFEIEERASELATAEAQGFNVYKEEHAKAWNSRRASDVESELGAIEAKFDAEVIQERAEAENPLHVAAVDKRRADAVFKDAHVRAGVMRAASRPPRLSVTCLHVAALIALETVAGFVVLRESLGQAEGAAFSVAVTVMNAALGALAGWGWLRGADKGDRSTPTTPFAAVSWLALALMGAFNYAAALARSLLIAGTEVTLESATSLMATSPLAPLLDIQNDLLFVLGATSFAVAAGSVYRYLLTVHGLRRHAEAVDAADAAWNDEREAYTETLGNIANAALDDIQHAEDAADAWRRAGLDFVNAVTAEADRVNKRIELLEKAVSSIWREYRDGNGATRDLPDPIGWKINLKPSLDRVDVPAGVIAGAGGLDQLLSKIRTRANAARAHIAVRHEAEIASLAKFFDDVQAAAGREVGEVHYEAQPQPA